LASIDIQLILYEKEGQKKGEKGQEIRGEGLRSKKIKNVLLHKFRFSSFFLFPQLLVGRRHDATVEPQLA
jgi:hypothetical protein